MEYTAEHRPQLNQPQQIHLQAARRANQRQYSHRDVGSQFRVVPSHQPRRNGWLDWSGQLWSSALPNDVTAWFRYTCQDLTLKLLSTKSSTLKTRILRLTVHTATPKLVLTRSMLWKLTFDYNEYNVEKRTCFNWKVEDDNYDACKTAIIKMSGQQILPSRLEVLRRRYSRACVKRVS
jgi:hypothetical protein